MKPDVKQLGKMKEESTKRKKNEMERDNTNREGDDFRDPLARLKQLNV